MPAAGPRPPPLPPRRAARRAPSRSARRPASSDETVKKLFAAGSFEEVPHDGMRKTIARRLAEAKSTIPHFYLTVDCDIDALLALREQINAAAPKDKDGKPAYKVSVNDMVIKAYALALQARAGRQRLLDRRRHAAPQACRCRRRRLDPRRADHADHPRRRHQDALGDLQRDEGPRRRAPRAAS